MKILIAEDDSASRLILEATLKAIGHEPIASPNGAKAWDILQREKIPVLITDWMMPEMDGPELCRRIRQRKNEEGYTYVILLTVLGGKQSCLDGLEAGADDFMSKPFDEEILAARLRVAERILTLRSEVSRLGELLPICLYCKKVRQDTTYWKNVEDYLAEKTDVSFTRGICPDCALVLKIEIDKIRSPRST